MKWSKKKKIMLCVIFVGEGKCTRVVIVIINPVFTNPNPLVVRTMLVPKNPP